MKVVATEKAPKALGPYSQGYVHAGVLYTAGQIAIDPAVNDVTATTIEEQTEQVCKNLGEVLKEAGTDFAHVLKTTFSWLIWETLVHLMKYMVSTLHPNQQEAVSQ